MALTKKQIDARRGKLTASRVACLMTGDAAKILQLYTEMIGDAVEDDLSAVWPVRLGEATEALNLEWYERKNGTLTRVGEVVVHPFFDWAAATLDAWDETLKCPIECKHVGGREPLEVIIERYQPQMQWQMECTEATQCALSVIMGANEPIVDYIPRDKAYADELVQRGEQFMRYVAARKPPVILPAVPAPADASKIYDMTGNNQWGASASIWLENFAANSQFDDAAKILKALVPADAKKCEGHGVQITRDRAGRLSLRIQREP